MNVLRPAASFRRLKASCLGCVIFLLVLFALLVCLLAFAFSRFFTKPALSAGPTTQRAIQLALAVPPAQNNSQPRGVFLTRAVVVDYAGNQVFLSSTGEGLAALETDDWATLQVEHKDGTKAQWQHDFRNQEQTQIVLLPAQDITKLFKRGTNTVTLTLRDLTPFTYWSAPYYLIVQEESTVTPTSTVLPKEDVSPTRLYTPTTAEVQPAIVNSLTPHPTRSATETATPTPATLPTLIATGGAASSAAANGSAPIVPIPYLALGAAGIALLIFLSFIIRARRKPIPAPSLVGWLDLFDTKTREQAAIDLSKFPAGLVLILDPLRVEQRNGQQNYLAALAPTSEGVTLLQPDSQNTASPQVLNDGERVTLSKRVELEYHNPFASENDAELEF